MLLLRSWMPETQKGAGLKKSSRKHSSRTKRYFLCLIKLIWFHRKMPGCGRKHWDASFHAFFLRPISKLKKTLEWAKVSISNQCWIDLEWLNKWSVLVPQSVLKISWICSKTTPESKVQKQSKLFTWVSLDFQMLANLVWLILWKDKEQLPLEILLE